MCESKGCCFQTGGVAYFRVPFIQDVYYFNFVKEVGDHIEIELYCRNGLQRERQLEEKGVEITMPVYLLIRMAFWVADAEGYIQLQRLVASNAKKLVDKMVPFLAAHSEKA